MPPDSTAEPADPGTHYFTLDDRGDGKFTAEPHVSTEGPWGAGLQHGGPPNALAVACAERTLQTADDRTDLVALRLASDFVGPVPVAPLDVRSSVRRLARSAALVEVTISAGGRDCLSSRVWFVRDADTSALAPPLDEPTTIPDDAAGLDSEFPYGRSIDWRFVSGAMRTPGPAAAWARPRLALFDGYDWSGLARSVVIADSGNGLSAELDWDEWGFLNVDLDVHLARPLVGEWVLLDARTRLSAHGSGLATSTLSDVHGVVGSGNQTLVVGRRPR